MLFEGLLNEYMNPYPIELLADGKDLKVLLFIPPTYSRTFYMLQAIDPGELTFPGSHNWEKCFVCCNVISLSSFSYLTKHTKNLLCTTSGAGTWLLSEGAGGRPGSGHGVALSAG